MSHIGTYKIVTYVRVAQISDQIMLNTLELISEEIDCFSRATIIKGNYNKRDPLYIHMCIFDHI